MKNFAKMMIVVFAFSAISSVFVSTATAQDDVQGQLKELEQKIEKLKEKIEEKEDVSEESKGGEESKISFSGYGELHYNHPNSAGEEKDRKMDMHRMVLGWEYVFKEGLTMHAEVDFEHAAKEMELEFAYIEKQLKNGWSLRGGSLLMPVGPLNEFHEPPLFPSVERPYTNNFVIPMTWQEGGIGPVYEGELFNFRGYIVNGLDGSKFRKKDGIRPGRGKVAESKGDDMGFVARLEYKPVLGLTLGSSYYSAGASQADANLAGVDVTLLEADLQVERKGLKLVSSWTQIDVDNADKIQTLSKTDPGSKIKGFYATLSYRIPLKGDTSLVPFIQYEAIDTHAEVPASVTKDNSMNRKIITFGFAYYLHENVAYKLDVESWKLGSGTKRTQWNAGIAWMF